MMRKAVSLLAGILLPGALCLPVRAGHIALRTRPGASLDHGRARVTLVILNAGDEPARSVWSEALIGGLAARTAPRDTLAVGATHRFVIAFDGAPAPPGIHTILLRVHYQDGSSNTPATLTSLKAMLKGITKLSAAISRYGRQK